MSFMNPAGNQYGADQGGGGLLGQSQYDATSVSGYLRNQMAAQARRKQKQPLQDAGPVGNILRSASQTLFGGQSFAR